MNRMLLEEMLEKMKKKLRTGTDIGNLKIGALFALGSQLEAIFYFIGHELGSKINADNPNLDYNDALKWLVKSYNLGYITITESDHAHIAFRLEGCRSCIEIERTDVKVEQGFCSFEAGLFAGFMEKLTKKHCFAQEMTCHLAGFPYCAFIIVLPQE